MTDSPRNLRGPAWGKQTTTTAPLYPTHLLNEMERYMKSPVTLIPPEDRKSSSLAAADTALLAYLREHVPHLIEAVRRAGAA